MIKYFAFLLAVTIISCSSSDSNKPITGEYKSDSPAKALQYISSKTYVTGSSLNLLKNNQFEIQTCGNIGKGNWKVTGDSLYLYYEEMRLKIDSLNYDPKYKIDPIDNDTYDVYFINGNTLSREIKLKNGKVAKDRLKKTE